MEDSYGKYCRVHFRLHCKVTLGQTLGLAGSCHSLGSFETGNALSLVTTPDSYPLWTTERPVLIKEGEDISYKYCILESGKVKYWEAKLRKFNVGKSDDVVVEDKGSETEFTELDIARSFLESEVQGVKQVNQKNEAIITPPSTSRVIIVCYHLPIHITRSDDPLNPFIVDWSESLIAKSKNSISSTTDTCWFGTASVPGAPLTPAEQELLTATLLNINCHPVYLDSDTARKAYLGFCKQILWPTFHNIDQLDQIHAAWKIAPTSSGEDPHPLDWNEEAVVCLSAFKTVNDAFLFALSSFLRANDTIWVHDYHLMLLPKLIRESLKETFPYSIVFFLHIPFPTSQVRTHSPHHGPNSCPL